MTMTLVHNKFVLYCDHTNHAIATLVKAFHNDSPQRDQGNNKYNK